MSDTRFIILGVGLIFAGIILLTVFGAQFDEITLQEEFPECYEYHTDAPPTEIDCDIAIAFDGQEALDKVASFQPDLILLDIMMPKLNGFEVCKQSGCVQIHVTLFQPIAELFIQRRDGRRGVRAEERYQSLLFGRFGGRADFELPQNSREHIRRDARMEGGMALQGRHGGVVDEGFYGREHLFLGWRVMHGSGPLFEQIEQVDFGFGDTPPDRGPLHARIRARPEGFVHDHAHDAPFQAAENFPPVNFVRRKFTAA